MRPSRTAIFAVLLCLPLPAIAQTAAPLAPPPQAAPPLPPPPAPRLIPTLSAKQSAFLHRVLDAAADQGVEAPAPADGSDQALVDGALRYARAVHSGSLAEADYVHDWGMRPAAYDPWPDFAAAVASDRLSAWAAALPPPFAGYEYLRRGLLRYRQIAARGGWASIPAGPDIGRAGKGARVLALRQRLAAEDPGLPAEGSSFDAPLETALKAAQRHYGLPPTGVAGAQTLAALNVSAADRVAQIRANMERWRWMPTQLPADRIQVNIAAAVLTFYQADQPALSMRAATGRPGDPTPILQSQIHSVVLNPPWNVPASIAKRELWPKGAKYLERNGYRVIATPDGGQRLQQKSGPQSALGRVKFDFDNNYGVYLHDTPARTAFTRYNRSVSHGCVRLEHPVDLAKRVLEANPAWQPEAVDATIEGGKTVRAPLAQPLSVYLLYWTAFASQKGDVSFRADPYDWDRALAGKLGAPAGRSVIASNERVR